MIQKLQNIIFPTRGDLENQSELFYRGYRPRLDNENQTLYLADNATVDFCTYLNSFSHNKWKKYTELKSVQLSLLVSGTFEIKLVGYHLVASNIFRKDFGSYKFEINGKETITLDFPANSEDLIGFEIVACGNTIIFDGFYSGKYDSTPNDITLCLATTTCRKEDFITKNINLIKTEIMETEDSMKDNFYVHVIDNGQTLDYDKLSSWHISVHPNKNVGGAGGFARGMIEGLRNNPKATHVLLMDDDVVVLPESIKRTYRLLTLLKPEFKDSMISGAMLRFEEMNIQHEDIGTLFRPSDCGFLPLKPPLDHRFLHANLLNEQTFYGSHRQYAAWWYCCIPITTIENNGLPLPIFIRCDDVEYGLRCKPDIITMNGICIWHMDFFNKYNFAIDRYQTVRNLLIDKAVGSISEEMDIDHYAKLCFRSELLRFNYNAAELVLKAFQDYMKGPEFIEQDLGEQILKENVKKNQVLVSFEELGLQEVYPQQAYNIKPRKGLSTFWYRLTFNGHRFWPKAWLKREPEIVLFNHDAYQPQSYVRRQKLLVVNPEMKTGTYRNIDKNRCKQLRREWNSTMRDYKKKKAQIIDSYKKAFPYLTSMEFWLKYLDI